VRVIAKRTLREFWERHADAKGALEAWHREAKAAIWTGPADIKKAYRSADFIPGDRVVFNVKGNRYRLIVAIRYDLEIIFIRFVGTHAEYDKVDAETV